jgi:hypothetical protein
MKEPRFFSLVRGHDESNVSGVGRVLDGVEFHNGQVVICWRTDLQECTKCGYMEAAHHYGSGPDYPHDGLSDHAYTPRHGYTSLGVYPSFDAFKAIHIDSHPTNATKVVWRDEPLSKEQAKDVYSEGIEAGRQLEKQLSVGIDYCAACRCKLNWCAMGCHCTCHGPEQR